MYYYTPADELSLDSYTIRFYLPSFLKSFIDNNQFWKVDRILAHFEKEIIMDEKEILLGKNNYNLVPIIALSVIAIACIVVFIKALSVDFTIDYLMGNEFPKNGNEASYWFYQASLSGGFPQAAAKRAIIAFAIGLPSIILSLWLLFASNCSILLTDKRVYGKASFGKQVSIPLKTITSVGTKAFNGICISSYSGNTVFRGISNRKEFFNKISQMLLEEKEN